MAISQGYDNHTINAFQDRRRKKSLSLNEQIQLIEIFEEEIGRFNDATIDDKDGYMLRLLKAKRWLNP